MRQLPKPQSGNLIDIHIIGKKISVIRDTKNKN